MRHTITILMALLCLHAAAREPGDSTSWVRRAWDKVSDHVKVTGYAQAGYTAKPELDYNSFEMYRAILMVAVDITPRWYAFFMHDFKSGDMQEYYMEYRPFQAMNFRFGQSKIELSMENPMSPTVLESTAPMSQGVFWLCGASPLMGNPAGRDLGLMMYGDLFKRRLRYYIEVVNGGRTNKADQDQHKNVIARLEYRPAPRWRLSVSGQLGYGTAVGTSALNPSVALGQYYRQDRYSAGAEWKSKAAGSDYNRHRCASVRAELIGGRDGAAHSFGGYVSTAIPLYKRLDLVAMADHFDYNTRLNMQRTLLMGGLQYWIAKKCRLQVQYSYNWLSRAMARAQDTRSGYN